MCAGCATATNQFAMMLARLFEGAVVSTTGCAAAEDVPSLNAMWVVELCILVLVSPTFECTGIRHRLLHDARHNLNLLTTQCSLRNDAVAT